MNLFTIAWKSMRQRSLTSLLTSLSVALGVMLMVAVLVISGVVERAFSQNAIPYNLVVGPKGSSMQLVLSAVYRIQPPIENLPYSFLEKLRADNQVDLAVPLAFGDYTEQGAFPIVGTTVEYFEMGIAPGRPYRIKGEQISGPFDAIIGSHVARTNNWTLGTEFKLVHGGEDSEDIHDEVFTVVAVLEQTGTPNDKTVFVDLEGFYTIAGHAKPVEEVERRLQDFYASDPEMLQKAMAEIATVRAERSDGGHQHGTPDVLKEVTAILLQTRSDMDAIFLSSRLKKGYQAQAVNPLIPMRQLNENVVGNIRKVLFVLTGLIIVVSGVGIFVSIYNSMSDRRREISIMRALGAPRTSVFSIILAESVLLCVCGGLLGLLLGHGLVFTAAPYVAAETGLLLSPWSFELTELIVFPFLFVLAVLVGFLPALTAYRTDVARYLAE